MDNIKNVLEDYLKISANNMYDKAHQLCKNGIVGKDCSWYHATWQYLRLLNVVSSPTWHDSFYTNEITSALKNKKQPNVLISGTADYTMLAYVIECIKKLDINDSKIYVLDTCNTPLYFCKWYAEKNKYTINTINDDILKYKNENFFDIICTDAFLTRFNKTIVPKVIDKWKTLLKINGKIITTIRIHDNNDLNHAEEDEAILKFCDKVKRRTTKYKDYIKFSPEEMYKIAENYARKMKSNNLGDKEAILEYFNEFKNVYRLNTIPVELKETEYLELVAEKL